MLATCSKNDSNCAQIIKMVYTALPMGEVPCNLFPFAQDSGYKNVCPQIIHNTETKHIKIYIAQNHWSVA